MTVCFKQLMVFCFSLLINERTNYAGCNDAAKIEWTEKRVFNNEMLNVVCIIRRQEHLSIPSLACDDVSDAVSDHDDTKFPPCPSSGSRQ